MNVFRFLGVAVYILVSAGPGRAGIALLDPPVAQRAALASAIVLGTVVEVEDEAVQAFPLLKIKGGPKVSFQIARVRVDSALFGAEGIDKVRVGVGPGRKMLKLAAGQSGCFFLRKHPDDDFYVIPAGSDFVARGKAKDYDRDVALARRCARLLAKPDAGLQAKDGEERLLTAAMLIFQYRAVRYAYRGAPRTAPLDAEQSKRILGILAEGPLAGDAARAQAGRLTLFFRLGVTEADGWKRPPNLKDIPGAVEKWLADNKSKYLIRRYVAEEE